MTRFNVAEWMHEEHEKVTELANRLRQSSAWIPTSGGEKWVREVGERFEHLRAHLTKHMALEEHEGYLGSVLERRPTLAPQVEQLKHEHGELLKLLDGIHLQIGQIGGGDRLLMLDLGRRIADLLSYIDHHEEHEQLLITYVFTQDIGTKD